MIPIREVPSLQVLSLNYIRHYFKISCKHKFDTFLRRLYDEDEDLFEIEVRELVKSTKRRFLTDVPITLYNEVVHTLYYAIEDIPREPVSGVTLQYFMDLLFHPLQTQVTIVDNLIPDFHQQFMNMPLLKKLVITDFDVKLDDVDIFRLMDYAFGNMMSLTILIYYSEYTELLDLILSQCKQIKYVIVSCKIISDETIHHLLSLRNLQQLNFKHKDISYMNIAAVLMSNPNLVALSCFWFIKCLEYFKKIKFVGVFKLQAVSIVDKQYEKLPLLAKYCPDLKVLVLNFALLRRTVYICWYPSKNIVNLTFKMGIISVFTIVDAITFYPNLEYLDIDNCVVNHNGKMKYDLENVQFHCIQKMALTIKDRKQEDIVLFLIRRSPNLKHLELHSAIFLKKIFDFLNQNSKALRKLVVLCIECRSFLSFETLKILIENCYELRRLYCNFDYNVFVECNNYIRKNNIDLTLIRLNYNS